MENYIDLIEENGLTKLKLNGVNIHQIKDYKISKKELDSLELSLTIRVNSKKSRIEV